MYDPLNLSSTSVAACPAAIAANGRGITSFSRYARKLRYMSGDHLNGSRGRSPNPTQSMVNVVKHDPRRSCSGHISLRVEIELRAGNISTNSPVRATSCRLAQNFSDSSIQFRPLSSTILLPKNAPTHMDGGYIGGHQSGMKHENVDERTREKLVPCVAVRGGIKGPG